MAHSTGSGDRIATAARELEEANRDIQAFLGSLTDEQWRASGTAEGWPVAAVAYHVADGYRIHLRWLDFIRKGHPVPGTPADLDAENAQAVADAAGLASLVVRSAVETGGRLLLAYVRDLDASELGAAVPHGPLGGDEVSVDIMLGIAPWHVREHLTSMRAAVARAP